MRLSDGNQMQLLELLIAFLLIIPIVKSYIYTLQPRNGLVWLPPIALASNISIFPAYGFRLECVALLLCNILLNILNIRVAFYGSSIFRKPNAIRILLIVTVILTAAFAVYFVPINDAIPAPFASRSFFDQEREKEVTVRLYPETIARTGVHNELKGVLVIAPPFEGVNVIDRVCTALTSEPALQDFLIVVLVQPYPTLWERFKFIQARIWGTSFEKACSLGREFEHEKKRNLTFLLPRIKLLVHGADVPVFLLGYDASGSAVYSLTAEEETVETYNIKGAIAIESRFWSVYYREEPSVQPSEGFFKQLAFNVLTRLSALKPKRTTHIAQTPAPNAPILFLTSDRIVNTAIRNKQYAAVLKLLHPTKVDPATPLNALLLAREGAGAFDYMDYPETQPLFSVLNPGAEYSDNRRQLRKKSVSSTAAVIAGFIESVLSRRDFHHEGYYQE